MKTKKKTKVICFANNKGGSGKSTTCASIAYAFSKLGKKVLLIDGDMQLNLTLSYFSEDKALEIAGSEKNLYVAVKEQKNLVDFKPVKEVQGHKPLEVIMGCLLGVFIGTAFSTL